MRRAGLVGWLLLVLAVAACALLFVSRMSEEGDAFDPLDVQEQDGGRPVLIGQAQEGVRSVADASQRVAIPVRVLDGSGRSLAGVRIVVRRAETRPTDSPGMGYVHHSHAQWKRNVMQEPGPETVEPPIDSATSAADGIARVWVPGKGDYIVLADVEPPRFCASAWCTVQGGLREPLVVLRVVEGSRLVGRVVGEGERGVHAKLSASGNRHYDPAPRVVQSDADSGTFTFEAVPPGAVTLTVYMTGRAALVTAPIETPTTQEIVIRVGGNHPLVAGTVRDAAGKPIAGAWLTCGVEPDEPAREGNAGIHRVALVAVSSADGTYEMRGDVAGPVTSFTASADGYREQDHNFWDDSLQGLTVVPQRTLRVDPVLYQGGVIEGQVTEAGTGEPLAGAEVFAVTFEADPRSGEGDAPSTVTGADGRFRVAGVAVGRSVLLVRHPTHYAVAQEALRHGSDPADDEEAFAERAEALLVPALSVFIARDGQRVTHDVTLVRGVPVRGRVLDPADRPVAGAQIRAAGKALPDLGFGRPLALWAPLAVSDAEGRFRIPCLAPRPDWKLHAEKAPWVAGESTSLALAPGGPEADVVLRVVQGARVGGRVTDKDGQPLPGRSGRVRSQWQALPFVTLDDGTFRVEGVPAGEARVTVVDLPPYEEVHGEETLTLRTSEVREDLVLRLDRQNVAASQDAKERHTVSGTLVDATGQPVPWTPLMARDEDYTHSSSWVRSGRDGTFRCAGLPAGPVIIEDPVSDVILARVTAPAADVKVTWQQSPETLLDVLVLAPDGVPVPLCTLEIAFGGDRGYAVHESIVNGTYRHRTHQPAPFTLTISEATDGSGRTLNLRRKVVELDAAPTGQVQVTLEVGVSLAGRVVDDQGVGVANVKVQSAGGASYTDVEGQFELQGLAEGPLTIEAHPPPGYVRAEPVHAHAGGGSASRPEIVVRLVRGEAIAGHVLLADGSPAQGQVSVSWPAGRISTESWDKQLDSRGAFREDGIPVGVTCFVLVTVTSPGFEGEVEQEVRAGDRAIRIVVPPTVSISGFVVPSDGNPVGSQSVYVRRGDKARTRVWTDGEAAGAFRVEGLADGETVFLAIDLDAGMSTEEVKVKAPAQDVKLRLPARSALRGHLQGAAGWEVHAWSLHEEDQGDGEPISVEADDEGRFAFDNLMRRGPWMIAAHARDDDRYARAGPFEADGAERPIPLRNGRSIEGVVVDAAGRPVDKAYVGSWADQVSIGTHTDSEGRFRLRGLPPGTYSLYAHAGSKGEAEGVRASDGTTGLRLVVKPE